MRNVILLLIKQAAFLFIFTTPFYTAAQAPTIAYGAFISSGVSQPVQVASAPGDASGRLFIVEKPGTIRIWNGTSILPTPFLDISSRVTDGGEQGLLSMAFHPSYSSNGFFFVYYNDAAGRITVERYQVSSNPDIADPVPNPSIPLVSISKDFTNHNGGHLQFKPEGGINYLYFATGDGGSGNNPDNSAQNPLSLLGKMIRMDVDLASPSPEIWAWGLRNPFRWSFDRATGDMWIGDVGQGLREEVNFRAGGTSGANFGWPCMEGSLDNANAPAIADCDTVRALDVLPVFEYNNPAEGRSVVGGYVYRGTEFPSLQGYYLVTDFFSGTLWLISPDGAGGWNVSTQAGLSAGISSISEVEDGTLYATSLNDNAVYKIIVPVPTPVHLLAFSGNARSGYNELRWTVEAEESIDAYVLEYSTDGISFQEAGRLTAANQPGKNEYSFRHVVPASSKYYYRLRIRNLNSREEYSAIITLGSTGRTPLKLYPTVVASGASLNVIAPWAVEKIIVTGTDGRQVMQADMNGAEGFFTLALPAMNSGIYLVRFIGRENAITEKIVVR